MKPVKKQLVAVVSLLAVASARANAGRTTCANADGASLIFESEGLGKNTIVVAVDGKIVRLPNVGGPLPELLGGHGYLASNEQGYALHASFDNTPIMGDAGSMGKAYGDLLTPDGRLIHLEELACHQ